MPSGGSRPATKPSSAADEDEPTPVDALFDTSAAVALVQADHESHQAVAQAVRGSRRGLAGHAWFETYSVLTRLPSGQRRSPEDVHRLLSAAFPGSRFLDAVAANDRSLANGERWVRVAALWWAARQSMSFGGAVEVPAPSVALAQTEPPPLRVIEGGGRVTRTVRRPELTLIAS